MSTPPARAPRRGNAILIALVALVVLAILSTGAVMSATQEFRAGRNSLVEQRALAVAEYGLNQEVVSWNDSVTLAAVKALAIGSVDSSHVFALNGDSARVAVTRLSTVNFLVSSTGRAGNGSNQLEAQRQTQLLMKVLSSATASAYRPSGALTINGDLKMKGNASLSGSNSTPAGWSNCPLPAPADANALVLPTSADAEIQKPQNVVGGILRSPSAADSLSYTQFGDDTWASLVARAAVTVNAGSPNPAPVGTTTACTPTSTNWGEPRRSGSYVAGCTGYFPVIYVPGDIELSTGRGQGVLLVGGKLKLKGNFTWVGLVVVKKELDQESGTASITGAIVNRNTSNNETDLTGAISINYSSCALDAVLASTSTTVSRVTQRSWMQLF